MGKDMIFQKQEIRNRYLGYRNSLTVSQRKEKSRRIREQLKTLKSWQSAQAVLLYMDYRSEVMTTELVEELLNPQTDGAGKRVFVPKVEGFDIHFYEIRSMEDLQDGYQGIREPEADAERLFTEEVAGKMECLVLVPGAVFDREGGRMGYGKGFYDRFLASFPKLVTVGVAFECQLAKKVPVEAHDRRMDQLVTENGGITCRI